MERWGEVGAHVGEQVGGFVLDARARAVPASLGMMSCALTHLFHGVRGSLKNKNPNS